MTKGQCVCVHGLLSLNNVLGHNDDARDPTSKPNGCSIYIEIPAQSYVVLDPPSDIRLCGGRTKDNILKRKHYEPLCHSRSSNLSCRPKAYLITKKRRRVYGRDNMKAVPREPELQRRPVPVHRSVLQRKAVNDLALFICGTSNLREQLCTQRSKKRSFRKTFAAGLCKC